MLFYSTDWYTTKMIAQGDMPSCSSTSWQNPGTHRCTGCKLAAYCFSACQKDYWKHTEMRARGQKSTAVSSSAPLPLTRRKRIPPMRTILNRCPWTHTVIGLPN
ncbi:hypothetical protein BDV36DRAFT_245852 [Aspergillus pseudocaelatus]|uniref:MYND-type zinc finger protein samB n=1 Tax=Aspergillus pseudocaelatus TaxID=1825620 RepID=A0ABQ6WYD0_9EURO|nr:hypothetical protein BDV36DRAFT_245852 [Aspergillus pseudocaelatus]